jgi:hypothetical protein
MNLGVVRKTMTQNATIGDLSIDGTHYCATLELPWKDNAHGTSCIPEGSYRVVVDWSMSKQKYLPHVLEVPGRDGIRIHTGNTAADTQGCILVGNVAGIDAVWGSKEVFVPLMDKIKAANLAGEKVTLTIEKEA